MRNQIILSELQTTSWLNRYLGNALANHIREEIDAEILTTVTGHLLAVSVPVPETPDWQHWLTDEMIAWCMSTGIEFTVSLEYNPVTITFMFESHSDATQFGITWL